MIIGAAIVIGILLFLVLRPKKKKPDGDCVDGVCTPVEESKPCEELRNLAVLYKGRYLVRDEVIQVSYNTLVQFEVKGFDITGTKEACIEGSQVIWNKSCPCTYWSYPTGLINYVRVNNKALNKKRNVWVKHSNGVTFGWRVEVV